MNPRFIQAVLESTQSLFTTMLSSSVTFGTPKPTDQLTKHDVSGIIGLTGEVVGSVVLCLPESTAIALTSKLAGTTLTMKSPDFADAVGELINMVAGGAKSRFNCANVSISCPTVVVANDHQVQNLSGTVCITIPCHCAEGEFAVNLAIQPVGVRPAATGAGHGGSSTKR
mgnify:CR=1 FL=1